LADAARAGDIVGRLGGDVFAVVGRELSDERGAIDLAGRLRAIISATPYEVGAESIGVTATLGLATGAAGRSGADLLSRAEDMMRRSKAGGGVVRVATLGSCERAASQLRLRAGIGGALGRGEIQVAYQPIVDLGSGALAAFEALARWTSPQLGSVSPGEFIPVAERTGDIVAIGEWVLRQACSQVAEWRRESPDLTISVNLAPLQLQLRRGGRRCGRQRTQRPLRT